MAVAHTLLKLIYQVFNTDKPYVEHGTPPWMSDRNSGSSDIMFDGWAGWELRFIPRSRSPLGEIRRPPPR